MIFLHSRSRQSSRRCVGVVRPCWEYRIAAQPETLRPTRFCGDAGGLDDFAMGMAGAAAASAAS
jgi:hypothetical protein